MQFKSPPKMLITNLATDERLYAQFNPEEFDLSIKAAYKKQVIPGMSHEVRQFSHTESLGMKFELRFQVRGAGSRDSFTPPFSIADRRRAESFLLSLPVPMAGAVIGRTVGGNAPPRVLVEWPNFLTLEASVEDVGFKYTRFNSHGDPLDLAVSVSVAEMRDVRYTSEYAREFGFFRYGGGGGGMVG